MQLEIIHHGTSILFDASTYRLKDLIPLDQIGAQDLRIIHASMDENATLHLGLSDGSLRQLPSSSLGNGVTPHQADLVIHNAGHILTLEPDQGGELGLILGGTIVCCGGRITQIIPRGKIEDLDLLPHTRVIDAHGGVVTPGLVDPHTHPVFAGDRCLEYSMKVAGKSYLEIHKAGGGILSTVRATRAAHFEDLARRCRRNLSLLLGWGVTTCEGKSGYALDLEGELRLLEVLQAVSATHPVDVEPTLLGAHTLPPEFSHSRSEYVSLVAEEMIPRAAKEQLAKFCDAYCEDGAFTTDEVRTIFIAAKAWGLGLRLHAEQFTNQEGTAVAASLGALSVDHLEAISPNGIQALADSGTTAILLPGGTLSCRCPWPPARTLLDAGVKVAIATDLNPGSSMTASLPLMMSLACTQLRMTCEEVWCAVTREAARSLGREDIGRIAPGCQADLVVFEAPDYRYIPYHFGDNHARVVIKRGTVVINRPFGN